MNQRDAQWALLANLLREREVLEGGSMRIVAAERLGQELGIEDGDALTQCCCSNRRRRGRRRKEASPRRLLVEATDDFVVSKH